MTYLRRVALAKVETVLKMAQSDQHPLNVLWS